MHRAYSKLPQNITNWLRPLASQWVNVWQYVTVHSNHGHSSVPFVKPTGDGKAICLLRSSEASACQLQEQSASGQVYPVVPLKVTSSSRNSKSLKHWLEIISRHQKPISGWPSQSLTSWEWMLGCLVLPCIALYEWLTIYIYIYYIHICN